MGDGRLLELGEEGGVSSLFCLAADLGAGVVRVDPGEPEFWLFALGGEHLLVVEIRSSLLLAHVINIIMPRRADDRAMLIVIRLIISTKIRVMGLFI